MARQNKQIAQIGVTGGIGSGKTAVCLMFERLGVPVFSADLIAREISDTEPAVKKAINSLLGASAFKADGRLDRPFVASRVFLNHLLQQKLNAIVHPEARKEIQRRIESLDPSDVRYVIVEAALLYEAGWEKILDAVVVVDAEEKTRVRRIAERDYLSVSQIRQRMNAQWSQKEKLQRADYAIFNNGTMKELNERVRFLHSLFTQLFS